MGISVSISDKCTGHGQCYSFCPEVFSPDDEGFAVVDETKVAANVEGVRRAEATCPEGAIEVVDN